MWIVWVRHCEGHPWLVWLNRRFGFQASFLVSETFLDRTAGIVTPFYDELKCVGLLFLLITRSHVCCLNRPTHILKHSLHLLGRGSHIFASNTPIRQTVCSGCWRYSRALELGFWVIHFTHAYSVWTLFILVVQTMEMAIFVSISKKRRKKGFYIRLSTRCAITAWIRYTITREAAGARKPSPKSTSASYAIAKKPAPRSRATCKGHFEPNRWSARSSSNQNALDERTAFSH